MRLDHIGLWEKGGVDLDEFFAGLEEIAYEGYITVHQAFAGVMPVEEAVRRSYVSLKPYIQGKVARTGPASES